MQCPSVCSQRDFNASIIFSWRDFDPYLRAYCYGRGGTLSKVSNINNDWQPDASIAFDFQRAIQLNVGIKPRPFNKHQMPIGLLPLILYRPQCPYGSDDTAQPNKDEGHGSEGQRCMRTRASVPQCTLRDLRWPLPLWPLLGFVYGPAYRQRKGLPPCRAQSSWWCLFCHRHGLLVLYFFAPPHLGSAPRVAASKMESMPTRLPRLFSAWTNCNTKTLDTSSVYVLQ